VPALANKRHELFAQQVVSGKSGTQAWLAVNPSATPKAASVTAVRTLANASVAARIHELLHRSEDEAWDTAEGIRERSRQAVEMAMAQKRPDRAAPHLSLLARRHPEFSEKHDVNMTLRAQMLALVAGLSEDELRAAKERLV
jgi:hypothetical protein